MSKLHRTVRFLGRWAGVACAVLCALAVPALAAADTGDLEILVGARATPPQPATPPLPTTAQFPVQLFLDDDQAESSLGVSDGSGARQFLWFNRFSPLSSTFDLAEIWVLFPPQANVAVGDAIQLAVYLDPNGDPTDGADLLETFDVTVQAVDGDTFSVYPLAVPVEIRDPGDVLVGAIPRFIVSGDPATLPAAIDRTASQQRSWLAVWTGDPPADPELPPDLQIVLVDDLVPSAAGNWMIRAFGTEPSILEIPTLGGGALALLAGLLALAAAVLLRRRAGAGMALALVLASLAAAAPAAAQTTIDNFTTNQATLTDPPGGSSNATGAAADILGTHRGLVIDLLTGAGPTSVGVAGGVLTLTVTNTTPDSRGEARLTWDGDTNPTTLSPAGLPGVVNLTAGGASGFRIGVTGSTAANAEIEIRVHSSAADSSRAARLLTATGAQTVFVPFAEFAVTGGAGANFADVGAIEMTLRSREGSLTLTEVVTAVPVIAATKVDALIVDNDSDLRADPGDRLRYTVTITNTGSEATNVDLVDTVDANTTLIAASVESTPVARNDQYGWFGNVTLSVDGTPFSTLLANDIDPDGGAVTVQSVAATSAQGGTVTLVSAATGEFTYSPPAGFRGVDSFTYTIVDSDSNIASATAHVTLEGIVWFVDDSNTTPPHLGTQADPFQTLASLTGTDPDEPGDIIFVHDDDGTPYPGGMTLEMNQLFLGEGVGLLLGGQTIVAAAGTPQITNAAGVGLTLAADNTVRGLDVADSSGAGIAGTSFGTLTADTVNVTNAGGAALDLATGTLAATFGTLSSTGAGGQRGIQLVSVTGSLTATTTSLTNPTTQGIRVATSPGATLDFGNTTVTDNAIGSGPTATGIDLATGNAGAAFTFDSLSVTADGAGLLANASGTVNVGGSGNSIAATGGPAVDITSTSLGGGATFATLSSTNSTGKGVNLDTVSGSFTANGGAISGPAGVGFDLNAGASNVTYAGSVSNTVNARLIEVTGRTGGTVTFSGTLSGTSNSDGIHVANNNVSGSPVITFSGATKTLNTGASPAVTLDNNDVATINFTGGGLDIDTTSGVGFNAINGAVGINVSGAGNSIFANGGGTALNVASTSIGASGLTFQSISAGTASGTGGVGISLDTTGLTASNGGLTVTGNSGAGTGGTIQHKTGADGSTSAGIGIFLKDTKNASFSWLQLNDFDNSAITGRNVQGFTIENSIINGTIGTTNTGTEGPINFGVSNPGGTNGLQGTGLIRNTKIRGGVEHNLEFYNQSGSMILTIEGVTAVSEGANPNDPSDDVADCIIEENSVALGADGIQVEMQSSATATIVVDRCLFRDNKSQAMQVSALNSTDVTVTIDESFARRFDQGNEGILLQNASDADLVAIVSNNRINNFGGTAIFVGQVAGNATSSSDLHATISGNIITQPTTATNHGIIAFLTSTVGQLAPARVRIDGNSVTNNSTSGTTRGILVDTPDTSTSPVFHATVTNNTVAVGDNVAGVAGLVVQARQSSDLCANIHSNTVTFPNGTPGGVSGLRARQVAPAAYDLEQSASCTGTAASVLACRNPASTTEVLGTITVVPAGACLLPNTL